LPIALAAALVLLATARARSPRLGSASAGWLGSAGLLGSSGMPTF
jgi:hypothetical protein